VRPLSTCGPSWTKYPFCSGLLCLGLFIVLGMVVETVCITMVSHVCDVFDVVA